MESRDFEHARLIAARIVAANDSVRQRQRLDATEFSSWASLLANVDLASSRLAESSVSHVELQLQSLLPRLGSEFFERFQPPNRHMSIVRSAITAAETLLDQLALAHLAEIAGNTQFREGLISEAVTEWTTAARAYKRAGRIAAVGDMLGNIGAALSSVPQCRRRAERLIRVSLRIALREGDSRAVAAAIGNLAKFIPDEQWHTALSQYELQADWASIAGAHDLEVHALVNAGIALVQANLPLRAEPPLRRGLARSRELGLSSWESRALLHLASVFRAAEDLAAAMGAAGEALAAAQRAGDRRLERLAATALGRYATLCGDNRTATRASQFAVQIARELRDEKGLAHSLGNLATLYKNTRRYSSALRCAAMSQRLAKETGETALLVSALLTEANVYYRTGRPADVRRTLRVARRVARGRPELKAQLADVLFTVGLSYESQGNARGSVAAFRAAFFKYTKAGDVSGQARCRAKLARADFTPLRT